MTLNYRMINQGDLSQDKEFFKSVPPIFKQQTACSSIVFDEQLYAISQVPSNTRIFKALNTCDLYEISPGQKFNQTRYIVSCLEGNNCDPSKMLPYHVALKSYSEEEVKSFYKYRQNAAAKKLDVDSKAEAEEAQRNKAQNILDREWMVKMAEENKKAQEAMAERIKKMDAKKEEDQKKAKESQNDNNKPDQKPFELDLVKDPKEVKKPESQMEDDETKIVPKNPTQEKITAPPPFCGIWFDGCNYCNLSFQKMCTEVICETYEKPRCEEYYPTKSCKNWFDGCNECLVENGKLTNQCSRKSCDEQKQPYCKTYYNSDETFQSASHAHDGAQKRAVVLLGVATLAGMVMII